MGRNSDSQRKEPSLRRRTPYYEELLLSLLFPVELALIRETHCSWEFVHPFWSAAHAVSLYMGSWQGEPSGTVTTRRPPTVEFSRFHDDVDGQQGLPGMQRHVAEPVDANIVDSAELANACLKSLV